MSATTADTPAAVEAAAATDAAQSGAGAGAGAGGAGAGADVSAAVAADAPTGPPNKRGPKYDKVDAGMSEFLASYPVDVTGRMATMCYFLKKHFKKFWFVGFYVVHGADKLMIGPYQGDVLASGIIDFGKGVCGTGAATQETQIVADVTKCDNYIACDLETKSEIVVPVYGSEGQLIAVLDIDSSDFAAFDELDKTRLEALCGKFFGKKA